MEQENRGAKQARMVRGATLQFIQRLRIMLGSMGDDGGALAGVLDRPTADAIAGQLCTKLGLESPPQHPWDGRALDPKRKGKVKGEGKR